MIEFDEPEPKRVRGFRPDTKLDEIDRALMAALAQDARLPNNALADRVGVAPSTCSLRLKRLVEVGAIRGFHAEFATEALGRPIQALISVKVQPNARTRIGDYTRRIAALPGVLNVFFLAGVNDFMIQVAAASTDDLRQFVTDHLSASSEFASTETNLVFDHVRGTTL